MVRGTLIPKTSKGFRAPPGSSRSSTVSRVSRVSGFGFRVSGFGLRISGFGFRVLSFGFRIVDFGLRVESSGLRVEFLEFRVSVFGFRVSGFGSRDFHRVRVEDHGGVGRGQTLTPMAHVIWGARCGWVRG